MNYETTEVLINQARAAGFDVSPSRLTDLHNAGLLPAPLGPKTGSESRYPLGTGSQLLVLCGLELRFPRERDRVGWELWLLNFEVDSAYWLGPFKTAAAQLKYVAKGGFEPNEPNDTSAHVLSERGERSIKKIASADKPSPLMRFFRRKIGRRVLTEIFGQLMQAMVGGFETPKHDEGERESWIFRYGRLLGLFAGSHKRRSGDHASDKAIVVEFLDKLSKISDRFVDVQQVSASMRDQHVFRAWAQEVRAIQIALARSTDTSLLVKVAAKILLDMKPAKHAMATLFWRAANDVPEVNEGMSRIRTRSKQIAAQGGLGHA